MTSMAGSRERSQLRRRPLDDLTSHIVRNTAIQVDGGAFGDIYKCEYKATLGSSSLVAVKKLRFFESEDPDENRRKFEDLYERNLRPELGILRRLEHPNIVPLLGVTYGFGPTIAAVFPWMSNGSLHSFLKKKGQTLNIDKRLQMSRDIGAGLEYLHSNRVFHGDLHSGNVLIDQECIPRISDFGLACTIEKLEPGLTYLERLDGITSVGAERWAAPERLTGSKPHPSADIYSFGCIMYEVLSGDVPWKEVTHYVVIGFKMNDHKLPTRPTHVGIKDDHWALMVQCLALPPQRPTASDVVTTLRSFIGSVIS